MGWEAWYTLAVVVATIVVLARSWLPPSGAMLGAMVAVLVPEIITPAQAFAGFANPAPITIAALYVVAKAVEKTGVLAPIVGWMLGSGDNERASLARIAMPTTAVSAFLNNTPIVAMLIPQVEAWARAHNRSISNYLMPLSFAAVLGGAITLMGTATNIIASGLLEAIGEEPLGFFEITIVGLPIAVAGIVALVVLAPIVVPERRSARGNLEEEFREFIVDMIVEADGIIDGSTVMNAGLRHLEGVFLVGLERGGAVVAPVNPNTRLRGGEIGRGAGRGRG